MRARAVLLVGLSLGAAAWLVPSRARAAGWTNQLMWNAGGTARSVAAGAGRNDGINHLYFANPNNSVYEGTWIDGGSTWTIVAIGSAPVGVNAATLGNGRNDTTQRIYAVSGPDVFEYTLSSTWTRVTAASFSGANLSKVVVGAGRSDGVNRIYVNDNTAASGPCYEVSFNTVTVSWSTATVGTGAKQSVDVGVGRNDGITRVYAVHEGGALNEFTWSGSSWSSTSVGSQGANGDLRVGDGRGDSVNRIYGTSQDGSIYEFSWTGSTWTSAVLYSTSTPAWGRAHFGAARNDGVVRLFSGIGSGLEEREFTWTGSSWTMVIIGPFANTAGWDTIVANGRGDGVNRVYTTGNFVYELTYDTVAPSVPAGLGVSSVVTGTALRLYWTAPTESDLKDYGVHRATFSSALSQKVLQTRVAAPGTTHLDGGLVNGTTFYYQVTARDASLNESSGSSEASGVPQDTTAPANPAGLGVTDAGSSGALRLSWTANTESDLKDYRVYRGLSSGGIGTKSLLATMVAPGTTHQDAGLVNGTTYYYQLTARDATGNESAGGSAEASAYPSGGADTTPPGAITDLTATMQAQVLLSWTAPSDNIGVTSYLVRHSTLAAIVTEGDWTGATAVVGAAVPPPTGPGTTQTATITGLTPRTTYWFAIKSQDAAGNLSALDSSSPEPNALAGSFVLGPEPAGVTGPAAGEVAWGDYDNDGDLDLLAKGRDGTGSRVRLYRNDGGTFVLVQEPAGATSPLGDSGYAAWGDYDRDGDLDLALTGYDGTTFLFRVYRNDGGTFNLAQEPAGSGGPGSGAVAWGDYDNDGDLDLAVMGEDGTSYRFRVYRNDATTFNLVQEPSGAVGPGQGSVAWGDPDNDGDLDLAISGYDGTAQRFRVYRNDGGTFNLAQEPAGPAGPGGSVAWGDFDNDGDLDLAVNGPDGTAFRFRVYRNDGGTFNLAQEPAGATGPGNGSVAWADYDGDGDLDVAAQGQDGTGYRLRVYKSLEADFGNVNTAPAAPSGLTQSFSSNTATLTWAFGSDSQSPTYGLYYQVRVSTIAGGGNKWVVSDKQGSPLLGNYLRALTTSPAQGRMILKGLATGTTYYWAVRTIDAGLRASAWSVESSTRIVGAGEDTTPPATPTGLTVTQPAQDRTLVISWSANTEPDFSQYRLYKATFSGTVASKTSIITVTVTGYTEGGLQDGTTYYYQLTAVDGSANASGATTEVSGVTRGGQDTTPPAAISDLTALVGASDGRVGLAWTAPGDDGMVGTATTYELRRATYQITTPADYTTAVIVATASWVGNATPAVAGTASSTTIVGLNPGVTYYFSMKARDEAGNLSSLAPPVNNWAPAQNGPPSAPATPNGSSPGGGIINLYWTANTEADLKDYRLYRSTNAGVTLVSSHVVAAVAVPGTTRQDGGLTQAINYFYRLTARDTVLYESGGSGERIIFAGDLIAPSSPTALGVANPGLGGRLNLSWTANSEADLKDYRTWRSSVSSSLSGKSSTTVIVAPGTTHQDTGLTNGTSYFYQLTARDTSGNESAGSPEAYAYPADTTPPAVPGGVSVSNPGTGGTLRIYWIANTELDIKDYGIHRATWIGAPPSATPGVILHPGTTHQEWGLANGTTYYYRVTARDVSGNNSSASVEASAYPSGADSTPPAAPSGLGVGNPGVGNALRLSWMANTEGDLKDYGVYRGTYSNALTFKFLQTRVAAPGTTHQDSGLANGTTYYYQITARDASSNESGGSAEVSGYPSGGGMTWVFETVDSSGTVGTYIGLALSTGSAAHIGYYDNTNQDARYAAQNPGSWQVQSVDLTGNRGAFAGLAVDGDGNPHMSYQDVTNADLRHWWAFDNGYSSEVVDSTGSVGSYTSLAVDGAGNVHIAYYDATNQDLKYAKKSGGTWGIQTVDSAGDVGADTGIALDASGNPYIAYFDATNNRLKMANWTGSAWTIQAVDATGSSGHYPHIVLSSSGTIHIAHWDSVGQDLRYAQSNLSGWSLSVIDTAGDVGRWPSIALDGASNAHIAYFDNTNGDLKYARWTGTAWSISTVDSAGVTGQYASIALGADGNPRIAYHDATNGDLRYALVTAGGGFPQPANAAYPTGLGATVYTTSITWTWTDNATNEQGYRVRSSTGFDLSGALAANAVSWTETLLSSGTPYTRYVQVYNVGGVANSSSFTATTLSGADTTPPAVPTGFGVANPGTGGRLNFSWAANTESDLKDYRVYRSSTDANSLNVLKDTHIVVAVAAPGTTHQDAGLINGTTYYYRITARDTVGNESPLPSSGAEAWASPTGGGATGNYLQVTSSGSVTAGVGFSATVVAKSSAGVTLCSATDVVTVTTSDLYDSEAGFAGALSSGTRAVSITLVTASTVTITASASGYTSGSTTTVVLAGPATGLQVILPGEVAVAGKTTAPAGKTGAPVSQSAGVAFTATVNAVDAWWNVVASASPTVTVVTSDPNDGDREPVPATLVAGTRPFSVAPITLGNVTVTASAAGFTSGTSASVLITNATPPSAPSGLTATPQEGATIRLAWTVSTSADVTTYRIYYATATSLLNFAAPNATVAHPTSSYVTPVLTAGQTYSFVVRAVNASGNEETNANVVTAQALATLAGAVRARVAWPLNGNRVAGARMTVIGEVIAGADRLASIRFDYRPEASSTWTVIPPAVAGFTNPDTTPPYFVQWDMRALPLGNYRLRAVAADRDGNLDPAPAEVSVVHVAPRDVDLEDTVTSRGERQVRQVVRRDQDNRIRVGDERGEVTEVRIPAGALVSSQTVVRVVLNPVDAAAAQAGLNTLGRTRRITFEDGTRVLSSTFTVRVAFRQDAAGNIQGTRASPRALLYCRYNPALRRWQWVPITAVFNSTRRRWEDARGNEITPAATRFGAPALAALAEAVPDGTSVVEAETNQDGDYALFLGAAENLDTTLVYPNPFKPNSDATHTDITFANLTEESTVEVLTVAGERVWMKEKVVGRESWLGTNETGEPVTTGVYVYVITSKEGQKSIGKLAVIR